MFVTYLEPLQERLPRNEIVNVQRVNRIVNFQNCQRVERSKTYTQNVGNLFERAGRREPQVEMELIYLSQRDRQHLEALGLGHQVTSLDQVQSEFGEKKRPITSGLQVLTEL